MTNLTKSPQTRLIPPALDALFSLVNTSLCLFYNYLTILHFYMISEDDVQKLASLARLELEPAFTPVITHHLNSILDYVQRLDTVDTASVEAMSHVHGATNVLREDIVCPAGSTPPPSPLGDARITTQEMLVAEDLLQNAPDHSGRFIRVPLIVE